MSITILSGDLSNKKNSSHWTFSMVPFPIFKVGNKNKGMVLPAAKGYEMGCPSRIIITKAKGTPLLIPVSDKAKDQKVVLISHIGPYKGEFPVVINRGVNLVKDLVLIENDNPFVYLVARYPEIESGEYIAIRSRRSKNDPYIYDIFYEDSHKQMSEAEYTKFSLIREAIEANNKVEKNVTTELNTGK